MTLYEKEEERRMKLNFFSNFLKFGFPNLLNQGVINEWWVMNQLKIASKMCVQFETAYLMDLSSSVFQRLQCILG